MKKTLAVILLLATQLLLAEDFTSSNLPIVLINTAPLDTIKNEPRVVAHMKIIFRGEGKRNLLTDKDSLAFLNYNGPITIEIRGSSSQMLQKKQYGFSTKKLDGVTNNNVALLDMPKDNDWILNGFAFDLSLMRDYLSYHLARTMGNYAVRTRYCEVLINGVYVGLYALQEKIKQGSNRLDIAKIDSSDLALPDVSGGYITKVDKLEKGDVLGWKESSARGINDLNFQHVLPKPNEVLPAQQEYIRDQFERLKQAAGRSNSSIVDGYPSVIDVPSFVDFMILNELASNVDGYQFSTFFHKDRRGKLKAGPIWDFNLTYGNDLTFWGWDRSKTNVWQFNNGDNEGSVFWRDLYGDSRFRCEVGHRWNELRKSGQPLNQFVIESFLDQTTGLIQEAVQRDMETWIGWYDHPQYVNAIKIFIRQRAEWLNTNMASFMNCKTVKPYPLVIDKIMYHPGTPEFGESDDQEFVGIRNNSDVAVDLTGIYFGGYGLSYTFPAGMVIGPQKEIMLCSDNKVFTGRYGFAPFAEYSRNLSNAGQKIALLDPWGNVIDEVNYLDESPWPDADGNGAFLELINLNLDNNLASSWITNNVLVAVEDQLQSSGISVYPNLVQEVLHVDSQEPIREIQLYDVHGHMLERIVASSSQQHNLLMNDYAKGIYVVKVSTDNGAMVQKVVKE